MNEVDDEFIDPLDEPLISYQELLELLDWEPDELEARALKSLPSEVSDLIRAKGGTNWTVATAPRIAFFVAKQAARRYADNMHGYVTSRAGDETLSWADIGDKLGSVFLRDAEIELLRNAVRGGQKLFSINTFVGSARPAGRHTFFANAGPGRKAIPYWEFQ